jgi:nicotinamide riboside kinase
MKQNNIKKIVVVGPESTGKSTLCEQLARHYNVPWCPEFAREYLLTHGTEYDFNDLLNIAKGQLAMEDEFVSSMANNPWSKNRLTNTGNNSPFTIRYSPLFIDTDMYVMKVWCEFVFDNCHSWILEQIAERKYDLYLLCRPDLPWIKDELREYPDLQTRERLYRIYKDLMINQEVPWVEISGSYEERLQSAIFAVNHLLDV